MSDDGTMATGAPDETRLDARNAYLEGELKRLDQIHTIALKEIVTLKRGG
jgi:hypothetical protein